MMKHSVVPVVLLTVFPVLAAEEPAATVPAEADPTGLIVFLVLMIAMIGGFFWYIWRKEKEKKVKSGGSARHG